MVEPIMYMAIGFLVSMLIGLMIFPLVHNRAVRLTTRRLEASTPVSKAEIQAGRDQLRAEFAMSARRLEMRVDQLNSKTTSQSAELGKKSDAINRLKIELGEKTAAIFALEAHEKVTRDQLRSATAELSTKTEALQAADLAAAEKHNEPTRVTTEPASPSTADAESSAVETLRAEKADLERELKAARDECARLERELGATTRPRDPASPAEPMDNATLRERINDVAAEVAKLAMTIEGPDSTIKAILSAEPATAPKPPRPVNGVTTAGPAAPLPGSLAERIRALQSQASQLPG